MECFISSFPVHPVRRPTDTCLGMYMPAQVVLVKLDKSVTRILTSSIYSWQRVTRGEHFFVFKVESHHPWIFLITPLNYLGSQQGCGTNCM